MPLQNLKAVAFSKNIVTALVQELAKKFMGGTILRDVKSFQLISLRLLMFIKDSARSKGLP